MISLKMRLAVASSIVLVAFLLLTASALDRAFRTTAQQAQEDKLRGLIYTILGAMEIDDEGEASVNADQLGEIELLIPDSSLSAYLVDDQDSVIWKSTVNGSDEPTLKFNVDVGDWIFRQIIPQESNSPRFFQLAFGFTWSLEDGRSKRFTLVTREDDGSFQEQLRTFQATLVRGLSLTGILLLLTQVVVLLWGLRPLNQVVVGINRIYRGQSEHIDGHYPKELTPLVTGINSLLQHQQRQRSRYQNALDDLAHSLKTPLAVLKGFSKQTSLENENMEPLQTQVDRLDQIVDYQLRRASTSGTHAFNKPLKVQPLSAQLVQVVSKAYANKSIQFEQHIDASLAVRMDRGDLMEIIGNLLDNACKWCKSQIHIHASMQGNRFEWVVDDDGPGISPELSKTILERGVRLDSRKQGQGIGLAVVRDIVDVYAGRIETTTSPLGGARFKVTIEFH